MLQQNQHYGLVKVAKIIEDGAGNNSGLETSRNYTIQKVAQATHHQRNPKYVEYAGKQCTANAYFAVIYSAIKNIGIWKSFDFDYILEHGDIIFQDACERVDVIQPSTVDQPLIVIPIEDNYVSEKRLVHESNLFVERKKMYLKMQTLWSIRQMQWNYIFMCRFNVAVLWLENHFYINRSLNNYFKSFYDLIVLKDRQYDLPVRQYHWYQN